MRPDVEADGGVDAGDIGLGDTDLLQPFETLGVGALAAQSADIERPLFQAVMDYTQGNQSQAAGILGINRGTLRKKLRTYSIIQ